jgi:hypothetical protein
MLENVTTITLPPRLEAQVQTYVQAGWVTDPNTLIIEALRRYLEAHQMELMEKYLLEDIEWGLHGND